ncbi:MAG: hypothetical protein ABI024_17590, partial [Vicinamibacterales bacterium]
GANRGDGGDPYPGTAKNVNLTAASTPSSKSYGGLDTSVTITNIGSSGATMKVRIGVKGPAKSPAAKRPAAKPAKRKSKAKTGAKKSGTSAGKARRRARRR